MPGNTIVAATQGRLQRGGIRQERSWRLAVIRNSPGINRPVAGHRSVGASVVVAVALLGLLLAIMNKVGVPPVYGAIATIAVFILACLVAGLGAGTGYVSDWLYGANRARAAVIGMVMAAGILSGPLMITLPGLFLSGENAWGPSLLAGPMLGLTLFTLMLAPYLRNSGAVSPASLIGMRFGHPAVRLTAAIAVGLLCVVILWAQLRSGVLLARLYFDLDEQTAAALLAILVAAMFLPGGQFGVIRTNLIFYAIVAGAFLVPLIWLSFRAATVPVPQLAVGVSAMFELDALEAQLRELDVPIFTDTVETGWPAIRYGVSLIASFLTLAAGFLAFPAMLGATQASRSANSARKSGLLALIFLALVITAAPAAAAFARLGIYEHIMGLPLVDFSAEARWILEWSGKLSLFSADTPLVRLCGESVRSTLGLVAACGGNPDHLIGPDDLAIHGELPAYAIAQMTGLPTIFAMFAAAGLFAAVLSTANCVAFMAAVTFGDALRESVSGKPPPANIRLFILRVAGIAALLAGTALAAFTPSSPIDLTLWAVAISASLAPVLIATVWTDNLRLGAALCGTAIPLLLLLLFGLSEFLDPDTALYRSISAIGSPPGIPLPLLAGFAGFVLASLAITVLALVQGHRVTETGLETIRLPGRETNPDRLR
jgi:cation/acetate symporter